MAMSKYKIGDQILFNHWSGEEEGEITRKIDDNSWEVFYGSGAAMVDNKDIISHQIEKPRKWWQFAQGGDINKNDYCIDEIMKMVNRVLPVADYFIIDKQLIIVSKNELNVNDVELLNAQLQKMKVCHSVVEDSFEIAYNENYKTLKLGLKTDGFSVGQYKRGGNLELQAKKQARKDIKKHLWRPQLDTHSWDKPVEEWEKYELPYDTTMNFAFEPTSFSAQDKRYMQYEKGGRVDFPSRNDRKNKTYYHIIWDNGKNMVDMIFEDKQEAESKFHKLVNDGIKFIQLSKDSFNEYGWLDKHNMYMAHPKFDKGGNVASRKADKRMLNKISNAVMGVWDKIGADSGGQIRVDKKLQAEYAKNTMIELNKMNIKKNSLTHNDFSHFEKTNNHLLNEFLIWNDFYNSKFAQGQKKQLVQLFKDYPNSYCDPAIIKVVSSSDKYIPHSKIKTLTVLIDGKEVVIKGEDVLNGVNL